MANYGGASAALDMYMATSNQVVTEDAAGVVLALAAMLSVACNMRQQQRVEQ